MELMTPLAVRDLYRDMMAAGRTVAEFHAEIRTRWDLTIGDGGRRRGYDGPACPVCGAERPPGGAAGGHGGMCPEAGVPSASGGRGAGGVSRWPWTVRDGT